jgi:hypothetical protein
MSKMTPWFPVHIKPVRRGVYATMYDTMSGIPRVGYSYWDGDRWANQMADVKWAKTMGQRPSATASAWQAKRWRGLAQRPDKDE